MRDVLSIALRKMERLRWWNFLKFNLLKPLFIKFAGWDENKGFYVLDEDWNYLIILDACRYDVFAREIVNWDIDGELKRRISRGSNTPEFLLENFVYRVLPFSIDTIMSDDPIYDDIIYITANPYVSYYVSGMFFKIVPVWLHGWNDQFKTVLPETVYEYTLRYVRKYGDRKRYIIHFMQPHEPYVPLLKEFKGLPITGFSCAVKEVLMKRVNQIPDRCLLDLVQEGKFSKDVAFKGYVENLRFAIPYVEKLCKLLNGKIVVTSDHGEAFGEYIHPIVPYKVWGHPKGYRTKELIEVPWFVVNGRDKLDMRAVERELIRIKARKLTPTKNRGNTDDN